MLDEADKLLELGFEKPINTVLQYLPTQRRTGLFSATQTKQVAMLVKAGLRNPIMVIVKEKHCLNPKRYFVILFIFLLFFISYTFLVIKLNPYLHLQHYKIIIQYVMLIKNWHF